MATPIPLNRCRFTTAEIIRAIGAEAPPGCAAATAGVSIDTRSLEAGALFVALRGVRDGHEFLAAAARRGAAAAIVERGRAIAGLPCFETGDTLAALGALAHFHLHRVRGRHNSPVIAIGGAAGKTTTKELASAAARALFGEILATPGNLNNLIGVPMTILTLSGAERAAVLECGTNRAGEIARLAAIVEPDVALVLNADIEHTEGLGSLEGVADEEAALFSTARIAVFSPAENLIASRVPHGLEQMTFGADAGADLRLVSRAVIAPGRQRIALALGRTLAAPGVEPSLEANIGLLGAAAATNCAAAVAAAVAAFGRPLGREQLAAIARALGAVEPVSGRLATRTIGGVVVIDDTYNANPRSVRVALAAARETADSLGGRLLVAMGDMLELGELSPSMHSGALADLREARPDAVVLAGPEFGAALARLGVAGRKAIAPIVATVPDSGAAGEIVSPIVRPGDILLVKGSRGLAMERVIEALKA